MIIPKFNFVMFCIALANSAVRGRSDNDFFKMNSDLEALMLDELQVDGSSEGESLLRRRAQECIRSDKQKATYAFYTHSPTLNAKPAVDMIGDIYFDNLDGLYAYGRNGIYDAFQFNFVESDGPGGYFGQTIRGDRSPKAQRVLFSLWDGNRKTGNPNDLNPALPVFGDGIEDCNDPNFDPEVSVGTACCKRNCNDCSEDTTTGTQCNVYVPADTGTHNRLRVRRVAENQSNSYRGITYTGAVWEVSIRNMDTDEEWLVGRQFVSNTHGGIDSMLAFHEHVGCVPCGSFDAETRRAGPWVLETEDGSKDTVLVNAQSGYNRRGGATCAKDLVTSYEDGQVTFLSGPSLPDSSGAGESLYDCGEDGCSVTAPKPCGACSGRRACAGSGGFCCSAKWGDDCVQGTQGRGYFYCYGGDDHGEKCYAD